MNHDNVVQITSNLYGFSPILHIYRQRISYTFFSNSALKSFMPQSLPPPRHHPSIRPCNASFTIVSMNIFIKFRDF